jgi:hypothetical protein
MKRSFDIICAIILTVGCVMLITGIVLLVSDANCFEDSCANPAGIPLCGIGGAMIGIASIVWLYVAVRSSKSTSSAGTDVLQPDQSRALAEQQQNANEVAQDENRPWVQMYQQQQQMLSQIWPA